MATINYTTLQLPAVLWEYSEVIQSTPHFEVRRYTHRKGIFFRLPHGAKAGQTFHAFMEHEVNLTNTLRTGTFTMKVQITFVPCHMGVFSGFAKLTGDYAYDSYDECYDFARFVPNYQDGENVKNIVPLPPNMKTNLYEYLNEILFEHVSDAEIISKYAVDLGCKKDQIKDRLVPAPVQTSDTDKGARVFTETIDFFNMVTAGVGANLLPVAK